MHRRPAGKAHAGLWEFPGGKIEPGESPREALVREIAEECGLRLNPGGMRERSFAADHPETCEGARPILLLLLHCAAWSGEVSSLEGGEWRWCSLTEISQLPKPPLDMRLAASFCG